MKKTNVKFACWNVNGIRSCATKGFWSWWQNCNADFICLQETKITHGDFLKFCALHDINVIDRTRIDDLPAFENQNTYAFLNAAEKAGYSGVAVFTKHKPIKVEYGIGDETLDAEGRVIVLHYADFILVNAYVPNAGRDLEKLDKKLKFGEVFIKKLQSLKRTQKHIIVCGDMNVAHREIDIKNPKSNQKNAGFTPEERAWFDAFLKSGYIDIFRHKNPELRDAYTWWSYRFEARQRNIGWRIDYFVISQETLSAVVDTRIHAEQDGSDHCPVYLECKF